MSMEDPFFVVKGEVQKAVLSAQGLHQRWGELLRAPGGGASREEAEWTTNELRNSLRSRIVESNPKKFNLDAPELAKRKAFISATRKEVQEMKEQMSSPATVSIPDKNNRQGPGGGPGGDRYTRLDQQLQTANSLFIEEQDTQQQLMAEQQDQQLELVSGTIGVLKNMSERIGLELDEQAVMLDDFTHEVDNTHSKLDNVMKKLAKVSHMTSDRRQWCAIGVLLLILLVVLMLFFIL
ncbi:unnamed protein product [Arctogadus glacialis]